MSVLRAKERLAAGGAEGTSLYEGAVPSLDPQIETIFGFFLLSLPPIVQPLTLIGILVNTLLYMSSILIIFFQCNIVNILQKKAHCTFLNTYFIN